MQTGSLPPARHSTVPPRDSHPGARQGSCGADMKPAPSSLLRAVLAIPASHCAAERGLCWPQPLPSSDFFFPAKRWAKSQQASNSVRFTARHFSWHTPALLRLCVRGVQHHPVQGHEPVSRSARSVNCPHSLEVISETPTPWKLAPKPQKKLSVKLKIRLC